MNEREPWFESLRDRRDQDFDGEACLSNEELDALLELAEAAALLDQLPMPKAGRPGFAARTRIRRNLSHPDPEEAV